MKRYRDYKLYCKNGQSPTELLDKIEQESIQENVLSGNILMGIGYIMMLMETY